MTYTVESDLKRVHNNWNHSLQSFTLEDSSQITRGSHTKEEIFYTEMAVKLTFATEKTLANIIMTFSDFTHDSVSKSKDFLQTQKKENSCFSITLF